MAGRGINSCIDRRMHRRAEWQRSIYSIISICIIYQTKIVNIKQHLYLSHAARLREYDSELVAETQIDLHM